MLELEQPQRTFACFRMSGFERKIFSGRTTLMTNTTTQMIDIAEAATSLTKTVEMILSIQQAMVATLTSPLARLALDLIVL